MRARQPAMRVPDDPQQFLGHLLRVTLLCDKRNKRLLARAAVSRGTGEGGEDEPAPGSADFRTEELSACCAMIVKKRRAERARATKEGRISAAAAMYGGRAAAASATFYGDDVEGDGSGEYDDEHGTMAALRDARRLMSRPQRLAGQDGGMQDGSDDDDGSVESRRSPKTTPDAAQNAADEEVGEMEEVENEEDENEEDVNEEDANEEDVNGEDENHDHKLVQTPPLFSPPLSEGGTAENSRLLWQDGHLIVTVLEGIKLKTTQTFGKSDPFVKLTMPWLDDHVRTRQHKDGSANPKFNAADNNRHVFEFLAAQHADVIDENGAMLLVEVHNENKGKDDVMGTGDYDLTDLFRAGAGAAETRTIEVPLVTPKKKSGGKLVVQVSFDLLLGNALSSVVLRPTGRNMQTTTGAANGSDATDRLRNDDHKESDKLTTESKDESKPEQTARKPPSGNSDSSNKSPTTVEGKTPCPNDVPQDDAGAAELSTRKEADKVARRRQQAEEKARRGKAAVGLQRVARGRRGRRMSAEQRETIKKTKARATQPQREHTSEPHTKTAAAAVAEKPTSAAQTASPFYQPFPDDDDGPEEKEGGEVTITAMADLATKLPTEKTSESIAARRKMFSAFDPNGNGYLSLAEVDKGVQDVLGSSALFDAKPVIMRAFQAAKGAVDTKSKLGADFVEKSEFFLLLVYLKRYFELFVMFQCIDTGHDKRIDVNEFRVAVGRLSNWGLELGADTIDSVFRDIDVDGGGQILFIEFSHWAIEQHMSIISVAEASGRDHSSEGVPSVEEARFQLNLSKDTQHVIGMDDHHHGREMTAHLDVHHITTDEANGGKVTMYFTDQAPHDAAMAWVIATKQVEIEKHIARGCPRESCRAARSKRGLPQLIDTPAVAATKKANGTDGQKTASSDETRQYDKQSAESVADGDSNSQAQPGVVQEHTSSTTAIHVATGEEKEELSTNTFGWARALYDFDGQHEGDLTFAKDDRLKIVGKNDEHWWRGQDEEGQVGIIPSSYVQEEVRGDVEAAVPSDVIIDTSVDGATVHTNSTEEVAETKHAAGNDGDRSTVVPVSTDGVKEDTPNDDGEEAEDGEVEEDEHSSRKAFYKEAAAREVVRRTAPSTTLTRASSGRIAQVSLGPT